MKNTNTKGQFRGIIDLAMPMVMLGFVALLLIVGLGVFSSMNLLVMTPVGGSPGAPGTPTTPSEPELEVYNSEISEYETDGGGISPVWYIIGFASFIGFYFIITHLIYRNKREDYDEDDDGSAMGIAKRNAQRIMRGEYH